MRIPTLTNGLKVWRIPTEALGLTARRASVNIVNIMVPQQNNGSQHNDSQHYDTQHNDAQNNDTQDNGTQNNGIQHKYIYHNYSAKMTVSIMKHNIKCCNAEYQILNCYADLCYVECRYA